MADPFPDDREQTWGECRKGPNLYLFDDSDDDGDDDDGDEPDSADDKDDDEVEPDSADEREADEDFEKLLMFTNSGHVANILNNSRNPMSSSRRFFRLDHPCIKNLDGDYHDDPSLFVLDSSSDKIQEGSYKPEALKKHRPKWGDLIDILKKLGDPKRDYPKCLYFHEGVWMSVKYTAEHDRFVFQRHSFRPESFVLKDVVYANSNNFGRISRKVESEVYRLGHGIIASENVRKYLSKKLGNSKLELDVDVEIRSTDQLLQAMADTIVKLSGQKLEKICIERNSFEHVFF